MCATPEVGKWGGAWLWFKYIRRRMTELDVRSVIEGITETEWTLLLQARWVQDFASPRGPVRTDFAGDPIRDGGHGRENRLEGKELLLAEDSLPV